MFRQPITQNAFLSMEADNCFSNIKADSFCGDYSLRATLRALLSSRMKEEDHIEAWFETHSMTKSYVASHSMEDVVRHLRNPGDADYFCERGGSICIHSLLCSQEDNYAVLEAIKSAFTNVHNGWVRLEKITDFYIRDFYVLCFVNAEARCVEIIVDSLDLKKLHYLQCSIIAFLPWYFDKSKGISEEEMELVQGLKEKRSPDRYLAALNKIASHYDFREMKIKRLLNDFETRFDRQECDRLRGMIRSRDEHIESYNRSIADALKERNEFSIRLLGLETKINSGNNDSDMMDFFLRSKNLSVESVSTSELQFTVKEYLDFFNEELASSIIGNSSSYVYYPDSRNYSNRIPHADMRMLMTAIFLDQTLRVKVCAAYKLKLGERCSAVSNYNFGYGYEEYIQNPHIQLYRCLGSYESKINKFVAENDYIGAVSQCVASCKSINFGDSTVMNKFMESFYGVYDSLNNRCIELPDGSVVTPKEAIKWLKKQQEGENNE